MDVLVLRLEAPLMSFGGAMVDNIGVIQPFPGASMLTGLLANALGYTHGESGRLQRLQERLRFAARLDEVGPTIVDYQTVDLGQDFLVGTGWTTWGKPDRRGEGAATKETHLRFRHFTAGGAVTVVVVLDPADESPTLPELERALNEPARPLFIGRKTCLPSGPICRGMMRADSLVDALRRIPCRRRRVEAQWPSDEEALPGSRVVSVYDERDWENQMHTGERRVRRGIIDVSP